jgi:hypothetical protein
MDGLQDTPYVERPDFFNGQQLFASDLKYIDALNREMRWLHNKSLHQPGVGSGYAVAGNKGDRTIIVGAGYALDADGREIILTREQTLAVPPVEGEEDGTPSMFDLTVSYADELEETETRQGICSPRGVVRRQEEPVFCWVPLHCEETIKNGQTTTHCLAEVENRKAIQGGLKIVLARIAVKHCALAERISLAHRRSARSCRQPCVSGGRVSLETFESPNEEEIIATLQRTSRQILKKSAAHEEAGNESQAIDSIHVLQGRVDTAFANFMTVPSYHVTLQRAAVGSSEARIPPLVVHWVQDQQPNSFTILLGFFGQRGMDAAHVKSEVVKYWELSWIGIEG